jgi:hypothetical protein
MFAELVNIVLKAILKYHQKEHWKLDIVSFGTLASMHLFFIVSLFATNTYKQLPILIFISGSAFVAYSVLHFTPFLLNKRGIYFLKRTENSLEKGERKIERAVDRSLR